MRGKHARGRAQSGKIRITPAYAGKTIYGAIMGSVAKDHPRVCGENFARLRLARP